jgi:hypothetical protein
MLGSIPGNGSTLNVAGMGKNRIGKPSTQMSTYFVSTLKRRPISGMPSIWISGAFFFWEIKKLVN